MKGIDMKLAVWILGVVFLAGGGWWSLEAVSTDVIKIQETLDEQESSITIHLASDGHPSGDDRMIRIEGAHTEMREDIRSLMVSQSAICQATGARCR